jgi:hypothetical protein
MQEMATLAERAKEQMTGITGLKTVTISGIEHAEGEWQLHMDLLEMSRIPDSTDLIGEYTVCLDEEGRLLRFERRRSRLRGQPSADEPEA